MLFKTKIEKATAYLLFIMLLCFCLCQYGLQRLFGFSLFPDEFGYWAPAAKMLGWDWSEATSLGSYYSFGYSLVLTPVLYFVKDSITAYRAAVVLNMVMMCMGLYFLYRLMQKLFPGAEKERAAIISGIAVLYPPWIFYMQMTMTEALLLFLYILICWIFICFLENPRALTAAFLVLALVYIYFVHMRSIGMIAAGGITLVLWAFAGKKTGRRKKTLLVLGALLCLFLFGLRMKNVLIELLYHSSSREVLDYNDYSGQWYKLRYLFSFQGFKSFLAGCAAKVLYLGLATYGLAYRGFYFVLKKTAGVLKNQKKGTTDASSYIWVFLTLASTAQFLVTAVYTIGSADSGNDRLDLFIHGRYSELMVPVLIAVGLVQLLESGRVWLGTAVSAAGTAIFTLIAVCVVKGSETGMTNVHGYMMIGMSYMLEEDGRLTGFLWKAWVLGAMLMAAVSLIAVLYRKKRHMKWFLLLLIILQIGLGLQAGEHYIYNGNSYGYGDVRMADKVKELAASEPDRIIFINEGGTPYIEQVQFRLRERKVEVWDLQELEQGWNSIQETDIVLLEAESRYKEKLETKFEKSWEDGHLYLYYNPR